MRKSGPVQGLLIFELCPNMHKFSYKVPASKTNYHLFSFFPNTIRDWNSLPLNVVEAQSVNSFRAKLDMF